MTSLTALFRRMLHGMLPAACKTCGMPLTDDPNPFFCRSCWGHITPLAGPVCPRCGRPFASATALTHSPRHLCGACRVHKPAYTLARSAYPYRPPLQDAIRLFKYQRKVTLAPALGDLLCARAHLLEFAELLIPVPLHPSRLREREFNQALLLADRLARHTGLPCDPHNLVRRRDTPSQTELS
ncbi:MAG: ComF family protein, partial [Nitrospirales bacterium]